MDEYQKFLNRKSNVNTNDGFDPLFLPDTMFPFQQFLTEWSIRKGRSALYEDCGTGKTLQELVWAENVVRHTNGKVLIATPLAVSMQTVREGEKFGIECHRSIDGKLKPGINITNYEKLHLFNPHDIVGMVCDESACIKNFQGVRLSVVKEFMRQMKYRLLGTATAAPNDYPELGTSSEALGYLGYMDMLNRFFKNDQNNSKVGRYRGETLKWRFKGHSEDAFWKWICSWARAMRKPSDLGFDDNGFILPPLIESEYIIEANSTPDGWLFSIPAVGLDEQRDERRRTITERCEKVAELVTNSEQSLIFCHLNPEGDLLEKIIPGSLQVAGKHSDERKEELLLAFSSGQLKHLVIKPKIGAWGLNLQNCGHVVSFPSHSFEQYYQGIRRCWRFGRKGAVKSDIVCTKGEIAVLNNLKQKSSKADIMFERLIQHMNDAIKIDGYTNCTKKEEVPQWLV